MINKIFYLKNEEVINIFIRLKIVNLLWFLPNKVN